MKIWIGCAFLWLLLVLDATWANARREWTEEIIQRARFMTARRVADATLTSPHRLSTLQAVFSATTDKNNASAEVGFGLKTIGGHDFRGSLKLAGPVNNKDSDKTLATLDGLAGNVTATAGLYLMWPNAKKRFEDETEVQNKLAALWEEKYDTELSSADTLSLSPAMSEEVIKDVFGYKGVLLLTLEGTWAAEKTFKYMDKTTLEAATAKHGGNSATVGLSWIPLKAWVPTLLGINYRWEESYTGMKKQQLCRSVGTSGGLLCEDIAIGAPKHNLRHIGEFEIRVYLIEGQLAIAPRGSRDFENDVNAFTLPIYFLRKPKPKPKPGEPVKPFDPLNGGVAIDWRQDVDDIGFRVFIGGLRNPLGPWRD
jgi:hypothetical protein